MTINFSLPKFFTLSVDAHYVHVWLHISLLGLY